MKLAPRNTTEKMTVAVGLSGGIDSAVTAWLLKEQGHDVIGLTMSIRDPKHPLTASKTSACYGPGEADDIASAKETAAHLGIPHHTISLIDEYERGVLDEFRNQHLAGLTPNPCALCNPKMKFGFLLSRAREMCLRFDRFATGHYARVVRDDPNHRFRLLCGVDTTKDQSYFLARLTQAQLSQVLFPLGVRTKREVRELARRAGLVKLTEKRESQDFFEGDDISKLFNNKGSCPGPILDKAGNVLGQHRGIIHYTVGQRDGLGLAVGHRVYVKELRAETNTVVIADREGVFTDRCRVTDTRWIADEPPRTTHALSVRLRYRHAGVATTLDLSTDGDVELRFAAPQFAVTPRPDGRSLRRR